MPICVMYQLFACLMEFHRTLKIIPHIRLFACSLEFHRTLKIIARILREVVNRERLCGTIAFYFSGFICLFCLFLFVCLYKTRKSILHSQCLEGSNNPWEWLHTESDTDHVRDTGDSCTNHILVNQWLTLYKLTGWLVSPDLHRTQCCKIGRAHV